MPILKHLVIFLYVAELVAFGVLAASRQRSGSRLPEQPVTLLCSFMVLRLIVKMVYFYVEFYILPWHLSIIYNALMDTTYVLSLALCLHVIASYARLEIPRRTLAIIAALCYVCLFALVSFLWVDRASNHVIIMQNDLARAIYNANELFFLTVALTTVASLLRKSAESAAPALTSAMGAAVGLYAIYVFFWDVSFTVPGVDAIRSIKPFDGVLVFGAVLIAIILCLCPKEEAPAPDAADDPYTPEVDLDVFAAEHGLTAREKDVLELLFQGKTTSQVAEELVISINTVKRHTYNLYRKAGVGNRYELLYKVSHPGEEIPASICENADE